MQSPVGQAAPVVQTNRKLARRAAIASLVGTAVEWYDYFIFGTASALVFGTLFFPGRDPIISTLSAFAVFGVGFVARPLGGIFFGHIGDKLGRKGALIATLLLMGSATFLIGCLPTAEQVGILAPILLTILRLVQGFGVGGEWGGAALVAVECAPAEKRGAYGAFPQIGNAIGLTVSTVVFAAVSILPEGQLLSWGWRIPFLISIVLVVVGMVIRLKLTETPAFREAQEQLEAKLAAGETVEEVKVPLFTLLRTEWRPLLMTMAMRLAEASLAYVILTIGLTYAVNYTDLPRSDVLLAGTCAAIAAAFSYFYSGKLSDRIGRKKVFIGSAVIGAVVAMPFFWVLDTNSVPLMFVAYVVVYALGVCPLYAVQPSFFSELFSTRVRYTGISLGVQIPSILVGFWPMLSAAIFAWTGGSAWPVAVIVIVCMAIGAVGAAAAPSSTGRSLSAEDAGAESK